MNNRLFVYHGSYPTQAKMVVNVDLSDFNDIICTIILVGLTALRTFSFLGSLTRKTGRYASPRHRSREK
jgi:hypothetical protein